MKLKNGISFLKWVALKWVAGAALLSANPLVLADTLIHNVKGYSLNASKEKFSFSALSFDGDKITGVYQKAPDLSGFDKVVDGQGQSMLPGLIDAHGHVLGYGMALTSVDLVGTTSLTQAQQRIREQAGQKKTGWVSGRGWNQELWTNKQFPSAKDIDEYVATQPVALSRIDGHALWVNSKALELAGIDRNTLSPDGGDIIKDKEGNPTGVLIDNAMDMVFKVMPKITEEERQFYLLKSLHALAATGLTSVHDAGVSPEVIASYKTLQKQGKLPIRVYAMLDITSSGYQEVLRSGIYESEDSMLSVRSVKISADGALGSRGAALHHDYSDEPGQKGLLLHSIPNLGKHVDEAMMAGFQVNTHAIGDKANTLVLDEYAKWHNVAGKAELRHRIEHAQIIRPKDLPRLAQLQVIASMQPTHATSDKNMAEDRLGKDRMKGAYAWASLRELGVVLAGGSDFPVEPAEPFFGLHAAVTRQDRHNEPLGGWYMQEAVDRDTALEMFTYNAAYSAHQENLIGTLEIGKQADFILIEKDYFEVKPEDIWKIKVNETWVSGEKINTL